MGTSTTGATHAANVGNARQDYHQRWRWCWSALWRLRLMLVFLKRLLVILDSILGGPWTRAFEGRSLTCNVFHRSCNNDPPFQCGVPRCASWCWSSGQFSHKKCTPTPFHQPFPSTCQFQFREHQIRLEMWPPTLCCWVLNFDNLVSQIICHLDRVVCSTDFFNFGIEHLLVFCCLEYLGSAAVLFISCPSTFSPVWVWDWVWVKPLSCKSSASARNSLRLSCSMLTSPRYKKSTIDVSCELFTPRKKTTGFSIKFCSNNALNMRLPDIRIIRCALIWEPSPQARVTSEKSLSLRNWAKEVVTFSTKSSISSKSSLSQVGACFVWIRQMSYSDKHRKNCECCPRHSLFKSHTVIVYYVVLNCQQSNQCLKCQVSGHRIFRKSEFFQKSDNFPKIWFFLKNLKKIPKI